jgi:hypothetical protein
MDDELPNESPFRLPEYDVFDASTKEESIILRVFNDF